MRGARSIFWATVRFDLRRAAEACTTGSLRSPMNEFGVRAPWTHCAVGDCRSAKKLATGVFVGDDF
jgi:hypothetical protein